MTTQVERRPDGESGPDSGARSDWDAIVIGAGLGGLSAAAYLATNGKRVIVLEQGDTAGGNTMIFRRLNKYEFDVGVHYIGDCEPDGAIPTVLRGVGLEGRVEFEPLDPDGYCTFRAPHFTLRVPRGWDEYLRRLIAQFPDEERGLRRCVRVLRTIGEAFDGVNVPSNFHEMVRFILKSPTGAIAGSLPLSWLFKACRLSQWAQATICAEAGTYATPPSRAPIMMHAAMTHHYLKSGAYYPKGGGQVIAANLVDVIQTHGGVVRTQATVSRIDVEHGKVRGVMLADGRTYVAPVVVSNADIKRTFLELIEQRHLKQRTIKRVSKYRMSPPMFCVYLALDIDLRERFGATQFWMLPRDDDTALNRPITAMERLFSDAANGIFRDTGELPTYVTSATLKDRTSTNHAPAGHSTLELMTLVPADCSYWGLKSDGSTWADQRYGKNPDYKRVKERITERLIDRAVELIPELREHIVWCEAATPITQERFTRSTGGTSYGIDVAVDQFGRLRPASRTEIHGLFLAGASTRTAHGVFGALNGGVAAASAILHRDLLAEVREGRVFGDPSRLSAHGPDWDPLMTCRRLADKSERAERARERQLEGAVT